MILWWASPKWPVYTRRIFQAILWTVFMLSKSRIFLHAIPSQRDIFLLSEGVQIFFNIDFAGNKLFITPPTTFSLLWCKRLCWSIQQGVHLVGQNLSKSFKTTVKFSPSLFVCSKDCNSFANGLVTSGVFFNKLNLGPTKFFDVFLLEVEA